MSSKITDWKTIGDGAHIFNSVNALFFLFLVMQSLYGKREEEGATQNNNDVFDRVWKQDGFCVANPDKPYLTSHDLCLYADVVLAAVVGLVYWALRTQPQMERANALVKPNILGIVAHGIGHGSIAMAIRRMEADGSLESQENKTGWEIIREKEKILTEVAPNLVALAIFWVFLLRSAMVHAKPQLLGLVAVLSFAGNLLVPQQMAFTYVQTVLFLAFDLSELSKPIQDKTFEYALYPLVVGLPLAAVAWLESTQCENMVIFMGGHLIYDAYIPIGILVFYLTCYASKASVEKKEKVS